jgi:SAM-dependent methyltransferase
MAAAQIMPKETNFALKKFFAERMTSYQNGTFSESKLKTRNGIPRFTPDQSYSENFRLLRERHSDLQIDSRNGTSDRRDTLLKRTGWPEDFFAGKIVLECGCGAGPDTEILLSLGCKVVAVDLTGCDEAFRNVGANANVQIVQADITNLPLKYKSFDIVFCHRVLQHTPYPNETLNHILKFVKLGGAVFVHSYARNFYQLIRWKYLLRPLALQLSDEALYQLIRKFSKPLFTLTNVLNKTKVGRVFTHFFVPFLNYRYHATYCHMSDDQMIEYAIHDTFDALSAQYDRPIGAKPMTQIASNILERPFEVIMTRGTTLLRSKV